MTELRVIGETAFAYISSSVRLLDLPSSVGMAIDRRFYIAVAISIISGLVRGFSGFGSALIYVPLISAVYEPRPALATLLLIDTTCGLLIATPEFSRCDWREVRPMTIAAAFGVPIGTMTLLLFDPQLLRWFIATFVAVILGVLVSGWRYRGHPRTAITIVIGLLAGFGGGAVQINGPPVVVYWLGGSDRATVVHANIMVFLALNGIVLIIAYLTQGLLNESVLILSILLGIPFALSMLLGSQLFRSASEQLYRLVAYLVIGCAVVLSLPVFDRFLQ